MTEKSYDIIVIGAGCGGLTAAACAAKEGKKVLLLERHNAPGGFSSSFVRGRFEFDISLLIHFLHLHLLFLSLLFLHIFLQILL